MSKNGRNFLFLSHSRLYRNPFIVKRYTVYYGTNHNNDEIIAGKNTVNEKVVATIKMMHVQSVLPEKTIIELKIKTGESSTKDAISKAVYHYLQCSKLEELE